MSARTRMTSALRRAKPAGDQRRGLADLNVELDILADLANRAIAAAG